MVLVNVRDPRHSNKPDGYDSRKLSLQCLISTDTNQDSYPFLLRYIVIHVTIDSRHALPSPSNSFIGMHFLLSSTVVTERLCFHRCLSVHRREVYTHSRQTPPKQIPLVRQPPGRHPLDRHPSRQTPPPGQTPPSADTPRADILSPQTTNAVDSTNPTRMHSCRRKILPKGQEFTPPPRYLTLYER